MSSLNPNTNFNVTAEQPVVDNSSSSLFDLANAAIKSYGSQESVKPEDDTGLRGAVVDGMKRIRAARMEGKMDLARRLELNMISEYTKAGGDVNDGWFQQTAQSITGRDVDSFSFSDEQVQLQALKESETYQSALAATLLTHPEASPEEREKLALGGIAAREARKQQIDLADFNFTNETATAYISDIDDFGSTVFGVAAAAGQQGHIVTLEEADNIILQWDQYKSSITRPVNVSAEAWAPVQEKIDAMSATFETFRKIIAPGNVEAQALSNLYSGIKAAGFPKEDQLLTALSADPEVLLNMGILPVSELTSALKSLDGTNGKHSGATVRDPSIPDPVLQGNIESKTPEELFTVANDSLKVANAHGDALTTNPDARENWAGVVARGADHLAYVTSQGEFVSEDGINTMFSPEFFRNMDRIKQSDPDLYDALVTRVQSSVTNAGLAADRQYRAARERSAFDYDIRTNTFNLNSGSIRRALGSETGNQQLADILIEAIDTAYGGDYEALVADRGRALAELGSEGGPAAYSLWNRITDNGQPPQQLRTIANSMYAISQTTAKLGGLTRSNLDPNQLKPGKKSIPPEVMKDEAFVTAVMNTSSVLNIDPNDLMRAIHFETAGTFDPGIKNPGSSATGLIQFIEGTAQGLGTSTKQLAGMSRAEQMAYVEAYLQPLLKDVPNPNFSHIYTAIHYPAAIHKDDSYVLYSATGDHMSRKSYGANKNLDSNGDGTVTRGEAWQNAWSRSGGASIPQSARSAQGEGEAPTSDTREAGPVFQSARPQPRPSVSETPTSQAGPQVEVSNRASQLSSNTQRLLARMQIDPNGLASFNSPSEVEAAGEAGEIKPGDLVLMNGQLVKYDG